MARIDLQDLSGSANTLATSNPYEGLISACNDDPQLIQARYQQHRTARNSQQRTKILANDFSGWILDDVLVKLDGPQKVAGYTDPRNCLVFWARPPQKVRSLISVVQQKLKDAAPNLWIMPPDNLHMTAMEVTHSLTAPEIEAMVDILQPSCRPIADHTLTHRARLIKPMLSYDAAALALSFVPAAGENVAQVSRELEDDTYTYHHLRRDVHSLVTSGGVVVGSRYVVPSAHLTIARFNTPNPFDGNPLDGNIGTEMSKRTMWLREIDTINNWLETEYWPKTDNSQIKPGGEWIVGQEKGLDFHKGRLWYGEGEEVYLGKGF